MNRQFSVLHRNGWQVCSVFARAYVMDRTKTVRVGDSKKKMHISCPGCQLTRLCTHGDRSTADNSMSKNCSKNETQRPQKAEKIERWGRSKLALK